jgi:hypothetical protein
MELIKKHVDTVVILGGIAGSLIWMNGKFNDIDRRLVRIETVMVVKGIMPDHFAGNKEE